MAAPVEAQRPFQRRATKLHSSAHQLAWLFQDIIHVVTVLALISLCAAWLIFYQILLEQIIVRLNMNDFGKFYYSAKLFLEGRDMYGPSPATSIPITGFRHQQFWNMNPPHFTVFVLPFTVLPAYVALVAWTLVSVGCLLAVIRLIMREFSIALTFRSSLVLWLVILSLAPTAAVIGTAQLTFILLLPLTLAWRAARRSAWTRCGAWMGLCIGVKPFLLLFIPYFLFRRRLKALQGIFVVGIILLSSGVLLFGFSSYLKWLEALSSVSWTWASMNGSLAGGFARVFGDNPHFSPIHDAPSLATFAPIVISLSIVAATLRATNLGLASADADLAFFLLTLASLLVSPLGWIYYTWLALGPAVALVHRFSSNTVLALSQRRLVWGLVCAAIPGLLIPWPFLGLGQPHGAATVFVASSYSWSHLLLWLSAMILAVSQPRDITRALSVVVVGLSWALLWFIVDTSTATILAASDSTMIEATVDRWTGDLLLYGFAGATSFVGPAFYVLTSSSDNATARCRVAGFCTFLGFSIACLAQDWRLGLVAAFLSGGAGVLLLQLSTRSTTRWPRGCEIAPALLGQLSFSCYVLFLSSTQSSVGLVIVLLVSVAAGASIAGWWIATVPAWDVLRRWPRRIVAIAAAYGVLLATGLNTAAWGSSVKPIPGDQRAPDILLVVIDCLRADRLGYSGHHTARTPVLNDLGGESVTFRSHYAAAPWTYPSLVALLSGRSPSAALSTGVLTHSSIALPHRLSELGYETALIGANPFLSTPKYSFASGFDHYRVLTRSQVFSALSRVWIETDPMNQGADARTVTDASIQYLHRPRDTPVFLMAHYMDLHAPYAPPEPFLTDRSDRLPPGPLRDSELYDSELAYVDHQMGRLLGYLSDEGRLERTVVVVTSDHGEAFMEHGTWSDVPSDPGLFDLLASRGVFHGNSLYDELIRVPLLIRAPGVPPRVEWNTTRSVDLLPTLIDVAGNLPAVGADGVPVLHTTPYGLEAFSEGILDGLEKKSIVADGFKLIDRPKYPAADRYLLFDLKADPGETRNIAAMQQKRVSDLAQRIDRHLADASASRTISPVQVDTDSAERLRSLGYLK